MKRVNLMNQFRAHIQPVTNIEQIVKAHLREVSEFAGTLGTIAGLSSTAKLTGLLHDLGKFTKCFDDYIMNSHIHPEDKSSKGLINHSTAGGKLLYDKYCFGQGVFQQLTAQMIALAIGSHHGGLVDCIAPDGKDVFVNKMETDQEIHFEEACENFWRFCSNPDEIDQLFQEAVEEIKKTFSIIKAKNSKVAEQRFMLGMLEKYIFSCLIDGDRSNTCDFQLNRKTIPKEDRSLLWKELCDHLELRLREFIPDTPVKQIRARISEECINFASRETGVYRLCVPTGGAKTLSSLRFALNHARIHSKDRIFFILPFLTILEQNAEEVRKAIGREDIVLEHHSNLFDIEDEEEYRFHTDRWSDPIIFTTMVQFLESLFAGGTRGIRRLQSLANSVIIFDEVQAIPIKAMSLFNSAMNFLVDFCNTTIILCSATQPLIDKIDIPIRLYENCDMIKEPEKVFQDLKRVNLYDETKKGVLSAEEIAGFIIEKNFDSTLAIVNTKAAARRIYHEMMEKNKELEEAMRYRIYHLSTNMCAEHRAILLEEMIKGLENTRTICISTSLIEAGVDISFKCVIRSLAGLDSIAQAAGRCNRHGGNELGSVFVIKCGEESTGRLEDIGIAQIQTERVFAEYQQNPEFFEGDLLSPMAMDLYYNYYFKELETRMNYSVKIEGRNATLYDLLSDNKLSEAVYCSNNKVKPKLPIKQAFKTAAERFKVIDQRTTGVIVPFEEGKTMITLLNGRCKDKEIDAVLKKMQRYSVNLFDTDWNILEKQDAIVKLPDYGIYVLREGFYDDDIGIVLEKQLMPFCEG